MRFSTRILSVALAVGLFSITAARAQDTDPVIAQEDVLGYLEQVIAWQRDAIAIDPSGTSARELIYQDTLKQNSLHVLQSGFKFARAEATHVKDAAAADTDNKDEEQTPAQRMAARQAQNAARIDQINARLAAIDKQLPRSKGTVKQKLQTEQSSLQDELKLINAKQELLQTVLANINAATSDESKGFLGKVNNLAHSIPELAPTKDKDSAAKSNGVPSAVSALMPGLAAAAAAQPAAAPSNTHTTTSVLSLTSDLFDLTRKQRELNDFTTETEQLDKTSHELIKSLRTAMDAATDPAPNADGALVVSVDEKIAQFKKIAADLLPLGDSTLWLGISKHNVQDWQNLLAQQVKSTLRSLLIHLAILAVTLAIPLVISSAVKRAIKRYVTDPKRERQAQTTRRVITGLVILFIILQNFISDFSSFATFAGFLTAGLAVALQSVLLSLVAHFFFYGRYGVRTGDRVNVGGVTGDILQIGMTRFYLRELRVSDDGRDFSPTGKVVAFPNSILFQNSAFYKYV